MSAATVTYIRDFEGDVNGERNHQWQRELGAYRVDDKDVGCGSTLGAPKVCVETKATGAIHKVYSIDAGAELIGSCVLEFWDDDLRMHVEKRPGHFIMYPEHQEHEYSLDDGVSVREDVFAINGGTGQDGGVDPGAVYVQVRVINQSCEQRKLSCYGFFEIDGNLSGDVIGEYDETMRAFVAWNKNKAEHVRIIGCSGNLVDYEITADHAMATIPQHPGRLSKSSDVRTQAPLAVLHVAVDIAPGASAQWGYRLLVSGGGRDAAVEGFKALPDYQDALERTHAYYKERLNTSVVLTPNAEINRGSQWAKANMLRVTLKAPAGWGMTNSPTMSNNSVARDTSWFAMGADYFMPEFSRASLQQFIDLQEPSGMIVEWYSLLDRKTDDFGLNINDDTPLIVLALWHSYLMTGDDAYLRKVFPAIEKAARYITLQRNDRGLVWCSATGTGSHGMLGWRNIIKDYRLSGATTEVNSECYAALAATAEMASVLGETQKCERFRTCAQSLKSAINAHLVNPANDLYYLSIDVDGIPRSDVTADLIFPVLFGVAPPARAAKIVRRLSDDQFWTDGGMRTVPRNAPSYHPSKAHGLLGGVWNGMTFWFAKGAAGMIPQFSVDALALGFQNYNRDPVRNNTVPGQFSEWLNGETLVNQGMMLSPWFPPRYLWAAMEGVLGFSAEVTGARVQPALPPDWQWSAARNVPFRGSHLSWIACRTPELQVYACGELSSSLPVTRCGRDCSDRVVVNGDETVAVALQDDDRTFAFVGNTHGRSVTTTLRVSNLPDGSHRVRRYDSLRKQWTDGETMDARELARGTIIELERKGFTLLEIRHG